MRKAKTLIVVGIVPWQSTKMIESRMGNTEQIQGSTQCGRLVLPAGGWLDLFGGGSKLKELPPRNRVCAIGVWAHSAHTECVWQQFLVQCVQLITRIGWIFAGV